MARRLMIVAGCIAVLAAFVRIRHERVGWGEYWSIELEAPWR